MPMPKPPLPDWTDDEVDAARKRGKQIALQFFQANPGVEMEFSVEEANATMAGDGLFKDRAPKWCAAMTYELHDFAHRFHRELSDLVS